MSKLLSDGDREFIYGQLRHASDDILVRAYTEFDRVRQMALAVRSVAEPETTSSERPNTNPGDPTITKIGATTEAELIRMIEHGAQPPAKYLAHMRLLWRRGKVKFDGKEWYL